MSSEIEVGHISINKSVIGAYRRVSVTPASLLAIISSGFLSARLLSAIFHCVFA